MPLIFGAVCMTQVAVCVSRLLLRRCLYEFSFGRCSGGGASVEILSEANLFIQTNCKYNSILLVTAPIVSAVRSSLRYEAR